MKEFWVDSLNYVRVGEVPTGPGAEGGIIALPFVGSALVATVLEMFSSGLGIRFLNFEGYCISLVFNCIWYVFAYWYITLSVIVGIVGTVVSITLIEEKVREYQSKKRRKEQYKKHKRREYIRTKKALEKEHNMPVLLVKR